MRTLARLIRSFSPVLVLSFFPTAAYSSIIVGIGNDFGNSPPQTPGILYAVDPLTGNVTAVGPSGTHAGYYPISSSPVPYSYFALSPVNHYNLSYPQAGSFGTTGFSLWDGNMSSGPIYGDYAYDSSTGQLFALTYATTTLPEMLVRLNDTGVPIPGAPNSHFLSYTTLAFPANLSIIEWIPGLGLYATDGHNAFAINETTGVSTPLPQLMYVGPTITGMAYDDATGRLIATGGLLGAAPGTRGSIYDVDWLTGQVTVLNGNAPDMVGLAAVDLPEPSPIALIGSGLCALYLGWRRRQR